MKSIAIDQSRRRLARQSSDRPNCTLFSESPVTLKRLMMMQRLDRACAQMNTGLTAVAIVLGFSICAFATIRLIQSSMAVLVSDMSLLTDTTMQVVW